MQAVALAVRAGERLSHGRLPQDSAGASCVKMLGVGRTISAARSAGSLCQ